MSRSIYCIWRVVGTNSPAKGTTICPGSSDPFYTVSYYIKWVTTFWTHSSTTVQLSIYLSLFDTCSPVYLSIILASAITPQTSLPREPVPPTLLLNPFSLACVFLGPVFKTQIISALKLAMQCTECPKIFRKSVLHLLKYSNLYLADAVQSCGKYWDTQYV